MKNPKQITNNERHLINQIIEKLKECNDYFGFFGKNDDLSFNYNEDKFDLQNGVDLVIVNIRLKKTYILALRCRDVKYLYPYNDITFRYQTQSGSRNTEWSKIQNGSYLVDFGLYCWADLNKGIIIATFIFDFKKCYELGLFSKKRNPISNHDNSFFININRSEFYDLNCVLFDDVDKAILEHNKEILMTSPHHIYKAIKPITFFQKK